MTDIYIELMLTLVIVAALIFLLTNGLHDASSVVATFISCGAATPLQAVALASVFEFIGAVTAGSAVADTVSSVVDVPAGPVLLQVLLAAITGAVFWNIVTWKMGFPSSSTHALVGGLLGAAWAASGPGAILWGWKELLGTGHSIVGIVKIVAALVFSPVLGFVAAFILQVLAGVILRNAQFTINRWIKRMQWGLAAVLAYSHGANDTQKVVGVILLALAAASHGGGWFAPWVKGVGGVVMFMGISLGGWSIMKTIGRGIYTIRPIHSLNSQLSAGGSIILSTLYGAPVSTTHVVVGSVTGVGAADEYKMVNWYTGRDILVAWVFTIPMTAFVSALIYYCLK